METIRVENIEELAERRQKACYGKNYRKDAHPTQLAETKQFYMMGIFEGMQMGNKIPKDTFDQMLREVSGSIQKRIMELSKNKNHND